MGQTPSRSNHPQGLSQNELELVHKLVDTQKDQVMLAVKKVELDAKTVDRNAAVAEKDIEYSHKNRQIDQKTTLVKDRNHKLFVLFLVIIAVCTIGWMLQNGFKDIVQFIVEKAVYVVGGGLGGYAIGRSRPNNKRNDDPKVQEVSSL